MIFYYIKHKIDKFYKKSKALSSKHKLEAYKKGSDSAFSGLWTAYPNDSNAGSDVYKILVSDTFY